MIAEYTEETLAKTYTWGTDLSGSMQGAGGVSGLLSVQEFNTQNASFTTHYSTYDGNGNVSEYLDATGSTAAHYEYDSFGNTTVSNGARAGDFEYKFSTKLEDEESGLYYYGYRYYDPKTGRWPSRDPIEEGGGINLYGFVKNDGLNAVDRLGMKFTNKGVSVVDTVSIRVYGFAQISVILEVKCECRIENNIQYYDLAINKVRVSPWIVDCGLTR